MSAYRDLIIADGPVAYWRLGETSGTTAVDEVGGNHLTYVGGPTLGAAGLLVGDADKAVTLDGATQYLYWAVAGFRASDSVGSVELWFNRTADGIYLFSSADNALSVNNYFLIRLANGKLQVVNSGLSYNQLETVEEVLNDTLYHLVVTSDGGETKIYLNGVEKDVVITHGVSGKWFNYSPGRDNVTIGSLVFNGGTVSGHFTGTFDEVAVYNRALTLAEIQEHYTVGTTEPTPENNPATGQPTITGTATVGQTLTASTSAIADADGLGAFSYQWFADDVAISGATSSTFALTEAQLGADISVTVSFTDGAGYSEFVTSAAVGPVVAAPDPSAGTVYRVESSLAETDYEWILLVKRDGD